ncbi:hypothetical protein G6F66_013839 [Rhizopus arrhizus]|nr:hypothetical protein G6F66_013839 [Rhizopus arrhizus]
MAHAVFEQPTEHHDLAVIQQHAGVQCTLVGDDAGRAGRALRVDAADFLVDVQLHRRRPRARLSGTGGCCRPRRRSRNDR